jgi:hypothetical protein
MTKNKRNKPANDARQSSEIDAGLGQDERAFGAGGQRDQNRGHQQRQLHDVDRDASLDRAGSSARTGDGSDGADKRR